MLLDVATDPLSVVIHMPRARTAKNMIRENTNKLDQGLLLRRRTGKIEANNKAMQNANSTSVNNIIAKPPGYLLSQVIHVIISFVPGTQCSVPKCGSCLY